MTSTDDILTQIDDAVTDWEIGPDAMRSRPGTMPGPSGPFSIRSSAGEWHQVGVATLHIDVNPDPFTQALVRAANAVDAFLAALDSAEQETEQVHQTRRTVQVATRKYRARRKR